MASSPPVKRLINDAGRRTAGSLLAEVQRCGRPSYPSRGRCALLHDALRVKAQRRILALDGGGIRGMISVEVLHRIEAILRDLTGRADLRLCEWFDLIAGTSTGAITAALLATGHEVQDVRRFYEEEADVLFHPAGLTARLHHRYDATHLARRLQDVFGPHTTLGSDRITTLLMLVLRNATTDSPWLLTNNPRAKYNDRERGGCNLELPLWQLVRGSTAAPTFFQPEVITVGEEAFVFSDGGVTCYNNPAFAAFLVATVEPYGLSWPTGTERLLLVSIGTGTPNLADAALDPNAMHVLYHAKTVPRAMLNSARTMQDTLCRVFGDCLSGEPIDLEIGDLIGAGGPVDPKLFSYLRYDVSLTTGGLAAIGCGRVDAASLGRLDDVCHLGALREVGAALAESRVRGKHLSRFLAAPVLGS